jgi:hypothetical protein
MEDALRHFIMGEEYDDDVAFKYGYGLEYLCRHFGKSLPNTCWSSMRTEWAITVDGAIIKAGLDTEIFAIGEYLMYRGSPIEIPDIEDFPGIGYMHAKETKRALTELGKLKTAAIRNKEARAALEEATTWLSYCAEHRLDLICFYA